MCVSYFWITDCLQCAFFAVLPMLADFLTKPLQGSLFLHFRSVLWGCSPVSSLLLRSPSSDLGFPDRELNEELVEKEDTEDFILFECNRLTVKPILFLYTIFSYPNRRFQVLFLSTASTVASTQNDNRR